MSSSPSLLAATDLSAPSRHAAQRAALLARQPGAQLDLVHVIEKSTLTDLRRLLGEHSGAMEQRLQAQTQAALTELAQELQASYRIKVGCHVVEGSVPTTLVAQADVLDATLLVVGARGAGFMRHWLLGATAERLLRRTRRPILVVKQAPHEPYRTVLVPVDFSPWSARAIELAKGTSPRARLTLLHVCELPFEGKMRFAGVEESTLQRQREMIRHEALARLHELAVEAQLAPGQWRPLVVHGNPSDCILEQEEEQGADLTVLGKHGMGMTEELLLGSVTKHVLGQARSDVLVVAQ